MIVVICTPCASAIRVMPTCATDPASVKEVDQLIGRESEFWPMQFHCPSCDRICRGFVESEVAASVFAALHLRDLSPQEAFAAFNGLGFPDEQKCTLEALQALLQEQPVKRVVGKNVVGAESVLVDALELWDGSKVYFGASADGALVYRVSRPMSYAAKVLKTASEGTP